MLVRFKRTWFAPGGVRIRPDKAGVEVSDEWAKFLPKDAEILNSASKEEPEPEGLQEKVEPLKAPSKAAAKKE